MPPAQNPVMWYQHQPQLCFRLVRRVFSSMVYHQRSRSVTIVPMRLCIQRILFFLCTTNMGVSYMRLVSARTMLSLGWTSLLKHDASPKASINYHCPCEAPHSKIASYMTPALAITRVSHPSKIAGIEPKFKTFINTVSRQHFFQFFYFLSSNISKVSITVHSFGGRWGGGVDQIQAPQKECQLFCR